MTETEWLACSDPNEMLGVLHLHGRLSERKARLFACACCRRVWDELKDDRSRKAVIVTERFADGMATEEELEIASGAACAAWDTDGGMSDCLDRPLPYSAAAFNVAIPPGWWGAAPAFVAPYKIILEAARDKEVEGAKQCVILRDIFGNPFRPLANDPRRIRWNGATILKLARVVYDEHRFGDLPILADALEEAGCTDAAILDHCRQPGEHVRGCWVVDLILGKA
jgi:hypothetical protein